MENKKSILSNYYLHVFGCRGSMPVTGANFVEFGGETSCYILKKGDYALIVDCGSGLYNAKDVLSSCKKIDVILTHVHYDHVIGLLGWAAFPKDAEINFYGLFDKWLGEKTVVEFFKDPFWPVQPNLGKFNQIPDFGETLELGNNIKVDFYKATHPNNACVCVIYIDGKKVVIYFDTESSKDIPLEVVNKCDILIYDGMYTDENYPGHEGWGHSTWQEGCRLAQKANPKYLIITHHDPNSSDYFLKEEEKKAQDMYVATRFARVKDVYKL